MIFTIYFIMVNIIAFVTYGIDKLKAMKKKYRVPEKVLITMAVIGGAPGALLGMRLFHHKTHKKKFYITVPIFTVIYLVVIAYWLCRTTFL